MGYSLIDIILVFLLATGMIIGFTKGFFKQLGSLLGLIVGLVAACALYASVAEKIGPFLGSSMTVAQVISFIAIWILVPVVFILVASLFTRAFEAISLGWLNRLLGLVLGAAKWMLIIGLLANVFDSLDVDNKLISETKKENSALYYPIKRLVGNLFPIAEKITQEYILTYDALWKKKNPINM